MVTSAQAAGDMTRPTTPVNPKTIAVSNPRDTNRELEPIQRNPLMNQTVDGGISPNPDLEITASIAPRFNPNPTSSPTSEGQPLPSVGRLLPPWTVCRRHVGRSG